MIMKPKLTIFVPTYNRAIQLENTISSIISQDGFEYCELVISDNCSTDSTSEVVMQFMARYKTIRYYSNSKNIGAEENFLKAFEYANGNYIEFLSDKSCLIAGALARILEVIEKYSPPHLFISNGCSVNKTLGIIECNSLSDYVCCVSYLSTWISGMVFKKSAIQSIGNLKLASGSSLIQTDWAFRVVAAERRAIILNEKIIYEQYVGTKSGYNLFEVFVNNYLELYKNYVQSGTISRQDVKKEKSKLLKYFVFPWYINTLILKRYCFDLSNSNRVILANFWNNPILYLFPFYLILYVLRSGVERIKRILRAIR